VFRRIGSLGLGRADEIRISRKALGARCGRRGAPLDRGSRPAGPLSYGIDGVFDDMGDERPHGRDGRIGVTAFSEELKFTHRLMKATVGRSAAGVVSPGP
jgi:hypothetical protein